MAHIFAEDDIEAVILVDASNAFNTLNKQVTLLNCEAICPSLLFVDGQCLLAIKRGH